MTGLSFLSPSATIEIVNDDDPLEIRGWKSMTGLKLIRGVDRGTGLNSEPRKVPLERFTF